MFLEYCCSSTRRQVGTKWQMSFLVALKTILKFTNLVLINFYKTVNCEGCMQPADQYLRLKGLCASNCSCIFSTQLRLKFTRLQRCKLFRRTFYRFAFRPIALQTQPLQLDGSVCIYNAAAPGSNTDVENRETKDQNRQDLKMPISFGASLKFRKMCFSLSVSYGRTTDQSLQA